MAAVMQRVQTCGCGLRATLKCWHTVIRDKRTATCDAPLCEGCAVKTATTIYCRPHFNFQAKQNLTLGKKPEAAQSKATLCIECGRSEGKRLVDNCQSPAECEAYQNLLTVKVAMCARDRTRISAGQLKYLVTLEKRRISAAEVARKIFNVDLVDCHQYAGSLLIQWFLSL